MPHKHVSYYVKSISLCILSLFQTTCAVIKDSPESSPTTQSPRELSLSDTCVDNKDSPALPAPSPYCLYTIAFPKESDEDQVRLLIGQPFMSLVDPTQKYKPYIFFVPYTFADSSYVLSIIPDVLKIFSNLRLPEFPHDLCSSLKETIANASQNNINNTLQSILHFYDMHRTLKMWLHITLKQVNYQGCDKYIHEVFNIYCYQTNVVLLNQAEHLYTHLMEVMSRHKQNKNRTPLPAPLIQPIDKGEQNTEPKQRWADLSGEEQKEEQEAKSKESKELPSNGTTNTPLSRRDRRQQQEIHAYKEPNTKSRQRTDLLNQEPNTKSRQSAHSLNQEQGPKKSKKPLGNRTHGPTQNPLPTNESLSGNRTSRQQRWRGR